MLAQGVELGIEATGMRTKRTCGMMLPYGATGGLETPPTAPAVGSMRSHTRQTNRRSVG